MASTYEIGYGRLTPDLIAKFSQKASWGEVVKRCEKQPEIDSRIQSVVNCLLQDQEFKANWDALRAIYGNAPSIKLCDETTTYVNEYTCEIPAVAADGSSASVIVLLPPLIMCSTRLFPSTAVLNLANHVFSLHIQESHRGKSEIEKIALVTNKFMCWVEKNKQHGGFFDLEQATDIDLDVEQEVGPNMMLAVSYKAGKRSVDRVALKFPVKQQTS